MKLIEALAVVLHYKNPAYEDNNTFKKLVEEAESVIKDSARDTWKDKFALR